MNHAMIKWLSAFALVCSVACSKVEMDTASFANTNEKGVFGYLTPFVEDDVNTRAYVEPDNSWRYVFEVGDGINIWSSAGTTLFYSVVSVKDDGRALFDGGGFTLTDNETYYSFHPEVLSKKYWALPVSFEGQTQNGNNNGHHLGDYTYSYSTATCTNGNTSFQYHNLIDYFRIVVTLPKEGLTLTELTITADKEVFVLNGTTDATAAEGEGEITPTEKSNTMTLTLDNVKVTDNVLKAFMASAPLSEAATYVISVKDNAGKVYTSPGVSKGTYVAGKIVTFRVTVESEDREYVKVTSIDSDPAGKYILVYPNGTSYRAFSFAKTMENAETAAASVASVSGLVNLYDQASSIYNTVIGDNYVEVTGEANATSLILNPEQEAAAAITIAANTVPWTVTAPAKDLKTTLTSGSYSLGVDHLVANVASDGTADLVAAFNAPDAVTIMNSLRGHNVNVTFTDLINLALAKTDGFDPDPNGLDAALLRRAFTKLVALARDIVTDNPRNVFPAGSSLMPISLTTNAFNVFSQYHDNAAEISWRISPEKRFGLAQLGYNINAQGFTASINLPSYEWINRLNEALRSSTVSRRPNKNKFIENWAAYDSQYTVKIDGVKVDGFFEKLATRFVATLETSTNPMEDEFYLLYMASLTGKFTQIATSYKALAEKLNTGIQPVAIYKKVVE